MGGAGFLGWTLARLLASSGEPVLLLPLPRTAKAIMGQGRIVLEGEVTIDL
jgi:hypothetical protein